MDFNIVKLIIIRGCNTKLLQCCRVLRIMRRDQDICRVLQKERADMCIRQIAKMKYSIITTTFEAQGDKVQIVRSIRQLRGYKIVTFLLSWNETDFYVGLYVDSYFLYKGCDHDGNMYVTKSTVLEYVTYEDHFIKLRRTIVLRHNTIKFNHIDHFLTQVYPTLNLKYKCIIPYNWKGPTVAKWTLEYDNSIPRDQSKLIKQIFNTFSL